MPKFSMAKKIANPYEYTTAVKVPGPGKYDYKTALNSKGNYFNSKHGDSLSKKWNPPRSKRFNDVNGYSTLPRRKRYH